MCDHKNIKYLGIQKTKEGDKKLYLYNCLNCHTTIGLDKKQVPLLKGKPKSVISMRQVIYK